VSRKHTAPARKNTVAARHGDQELRDVALDELMSEEPDWFELDDAGRPSVKYGFMTKVRWAHKERFETKLGRKVEQPCSPLTIQKRVLSQILSQGVSLGYDGWKQGGRDSTMIEFKGSHFERDVILWGVRWYVAYPIRYRQLEEMMEERGVEVDHSTLNRWVIKYAPELERQPVPASGRSGPAGGWMRHM
jgi:hypothetical protein